MDNLTACIFNIQKYSIHDGPGIRTVVFFKGCPLRCFWCSNPESQKGIPELAWDKSKCKHCLRCVNVCPENNIFHINDKIKIDCSHCSDCMLCVKNCPQKAITVFGEYHDIDYIMNEIMKDKDFYEESNGGVTLSGGEVLLQHKFASALLKRLKQQGIHTACETTGYADPEVFEKFIENVDLLLFDLKHYDSKKHYDGTGVHNEKILHNLKTALSLQKEVILRIPVIPAFNYNRETAQGITKLIKELSVSKIETLPFHQFGQNKYSLLNREYLLENVPNLTVEMLGDEWKLN